MKKNQKGQAVIEFIIFLPFILMILSVILSIANAINGSINQQKAARAYLFYRIQNDSTTPKKNAESAPHLGWERFGMYIIGWKDKFDNETPVAPCYKFNLPLGSTAGDKCDDPYDKETTQYIRIQTVFGICGASYSNSGGYIKREPFYGPYPTVDEASCLLQ